MSNILNHLYRYLLDMNFELRHLRYFLAVADTGHMTRAAATLGIQQPPLSMQIRALEAIVGMKLFHRRSRGMELTEGGQLFLNDALRIVNDVERVQQRMHRIARGEEGVLEVGFTSSAASHAFTPCALQACRKHFPSLRLQLSEDNAAELIAALASSRLHCAILRRPVARPAGIVFEVLFREPVMVALPKEHHLVAKNNRAQSALSITDLREEGLILVRRPGAPGMYADLIALCESHGFQPKIAAEVDRMMTNLNLVAAGAGVSVVPASMQGIQAHAVAYCPLADGSSLDAPITMAWREEDYAGGTKVFVELMRLIAKPYQRLSVAL